MKALIYSVMTATLSEGNNLINSPQKLIVWNIYSYSMPASYLQV